MHEIGVRVRDSDRELDGGGLVICEGLPRVEVEGRPGRGPVSIDSSSTDFDSVVLRLFLGCMLKINITKHRLMPEKRKGSYGSIWIATYPCLLS